MLLLCAMLFLFILLKCMYCVKEAKPRELLFLFYSIHYIFAMLLNIQKRSCLYKSKIALLSSNTMNINERKTFAFMLMTITL